MSKKTILIRAEWPKIRQMEKQGRTTFEVDARRTGTNGKQTYYKTQKEAEDFADSIAKVVKVEGSDALAMTVQERAFAVAARDLLKPYGKSVLEAAQFYFDHLQAEEKKAASATVAALVDAWEAAKLKKHAGGELAARTMEGIKTTAKVLREQWGTLRAAALTKTMLETYLDAAGLSTQSKENRRNLVGQCFNWGMKQEPPLCENNPASKISYSIKTVNKVAIFDSATATKVLRLCEEKYAALIPFVAIGLFAGLRPEEIEKLTWENVHLSERIIHVLGDTSKGRETRNVPIEETLCHWLSQYAGKKGRLYPSTDALDRLRQKLHVELGYKVTFFGAKDPATGKHKKTVFNPEAEQYPQDVLRHSYASHWLAKHPNRPQLAENMGNSVDVIKRRYRQVVSKAEVAAYWAILPTGTKTGADDVAAQLDVL